MDRVAVTEKTSSSAHAESSERAEEPAGASPSPAADSIDAAKAAGLIYVSHETPGIARRRAGNGFAYVDAKGEPIRDEDTLARIKSLVIPPAWVEVWIC